MPEPSIPEDAPSPKRRSGRKRGRRGTPSGAPPAPVVVTPPGYPAAPEAPEELPEPPPAPNSAPAPEEPVAAEGDSPDTAAGAGPAPAEAASETVPAEAEEEPAPPGPDEGPSAAPERGLARILGGPVEAGRPTWLDVLPERVGPLLAAFADEGARLLAMTVLPAASDAPPDAVALRYHFVVSETPITVSTHTPRRAAPSAAGLFPAMTWRERELAGEYGLRFIDPPLEVAEPDPGSQAAEAHPAEPDAAPGDRPATGPALPAETMVSASDPDPDPDP